ncbi:MAG: DNRLRE domain-containing protein [Sporocytophaga sp.]|nr:DNRLRE domain-containing protein [Sporocytophaga sp.]
MTFFYIYKKIKHDWIIFLSIFILSCSHPICEDIKGGGEVLKTKSIILKPGSEGKDAIISYRYPDSNYASSKSLSVITWKYLRNRDFENSFFDFDIEKAIPVNAKINKAVLKLYADTINQFETKFGHINFINVDNDNDNDIKTWKLNYITSSWTEDSITWNNQPQIEESDFVSVLGPKYYFQAFEIDVKKFVQKKLRKSPQIYGFKMDFDHGDNSSSATIALRFCSSDHQKSELWPELSIEYELE